VLNYRADHPSGSVGVNPRYEHLRTRVGRRLRAGTRGYGEVRVKAERPGARVAACRNYVY